MARTGIQALSAPIAAALVLLVVGPAIPVLDPWSLPATLPGSAGGRDVVAVADSQGTVTAVWTSDSTGVSYASRPANGMWSPAESLPQPRAQAVDIDVDPDDVVYLLLRTPSGLVVVHREFGGTWSERELVAELEKGGGKPQLDADGPSPVVTWVSRDDAPSKILLSTRRPDGTWTGPRMISRRNRSANASDLDVRADGSLMVVWMQHPLGKRERAVWIRERSPEGAWTSPRSLSAPGAGDPDLSLGENGAAAIGWTQRLGRTVTRPMVAFRREIGRTWRVAELAALRRRVRDVTVLAVPRQGVFAAWSYATDVNFTSYLWASHLGPAGWDPALRISPPSEEHGDPVLAMNGSQRFSRVRVFWTGNLSDPSLGNSSSVMSRSWGGGWQVMDTISSGHATSGDYDVALDANETGCVLFGVYDPATPGYAVQSSCLAE